MEAVHPWQERGCLLICPPCPFPFPVLTLFVMGAAHRRGDEGSGAAGSEQDSASSEVTGRTEACSAADGVRGTGSSSLGAVCTASLPWCCSVPAEVLAPWKGGIDSVFCCVFFMN